MLPKRLSNGVRYTDPSALDLRIDIQEGEESIDEVGNPTGRTTVATNVWASIRPVQGREVDRLQRFVPEVTHKIIIRYRADVRSQMLVAFRDRSFKIGYVMDPDERKKELHLICFERFDGRE